MKTVFIVGAGASVPYGLPTGEELRQRILSGLPPQITHYGSQASGSELDTYNGLVSLYYELQSALQKTNLTIDQFIASRPKFNDVGKLLIAAHVLPKELVAILSDELTRNWLGWLVRRWYDNQYMFSNDVEFITFNYDRIIKYTRCILTYLMCSRTAHI